MSINLPVWREKRQAGVAEAEQGVRMAGRQFADLTNRVSAAIHDDFAQLESNRSLLELYATGIIPQAKQSFAASQSAYEVGDADFLNLLDSLLTLFQYQIDYQRVLADHERAVARLEVESGLLLTEHP